MYHSIRASKELQLQSPTNCFWNGRLYHLHNTLKPHSFCKAILCVKGSFRCHQNCWDEAAFKEFISHQSICWSLGPREVVALPIAWNKWQHYVSKRVQTQFGWLKLNVTAISCEAGGDIIPDVKQPCRLVLTGKDKQGSITNIQFCSRTRFWCWQAKKYHPTISSISYLNPNH